MKLAIVGSRTYENWDEFLKLVQDVIYVDGITKIVSGGAKGADKLAEKFADFFEIEKEIYHADWNKHGRSAGYIRNKDIIKNSDIVVAFWDGESKGTKHAIDLVLKYKKELHVFIIK